MTPGEFGATGKVVFITGAERGIGIAQVLAEAGAEGGSRENYQYSWTNFRRRRPS